MLNEKADNIEYNTKLQYFEEFCHDICHKEEIRRIND